MTDLGSFDAASPAATPIVPAPPPETCFAPAGRADEGRIRTQLSELAQARLLAPALDAMPEMVMVLNEQRQILAANQSMLRLLETTVGDVLEKRPGEALGCIHSCDGPDGCGTGPCCATCGAVDAILQCQSGQRKVTRECRILADTGEGPKALDLRVTASVFTVGKERLLIVAAEDISQIKRLAVLQRTFFHDVLNLAGCVQGYAQFMADEQCFDGDLCARVVELSGQIVEAVRAQRDLVQAEAGEFQIQLAEFHTRGVLDKLRLQFLKHPGAGQRGIVLGQVWEGTIVSDQAILLRVLGNMLKNALEATAPDATVTIGCREHGDAVRFFVHNAEVIPEEIQLQIFHRSFSTKGQAGRGIGTYSMKLFGERYLGGHVAFVSRAPQGTTFYLDLPRSVLDDPS